MRLLLLTLQRRGELALAEWREFDFKARTWTIPDSHAKSAKGHVVPLSEWAIEELQKLKVMAGGSRYVLPNADKTAPADPKYITRSVARCLKLFKKHGVGGRVTDLAGPSMLSDTGLPCIAGNTLGSFPLDGPALRIRWAAKGRDPARLLRDGFEILNERPALLIG